MGVGKFADTLACSRAANESSGKPMVATKFLSVGTHGRQRIDRYELVGEIASGGMATVYLARLTGVGGFQRFVAIKRLHPHLAAENEFVQMFLDEARLAAGIHHPNVVPILEVGASDLGYYLVMEYIEGDTLARLLARASSQKDRLPVPIGLRIVIDMLAGLHAAHELRDEKGLPTHLVHRDVSPQNVLVGSDGIARITDFGVARAASRLSETRVGQLKGKIAYMAPEQAMGAEEIDRRADVFSSGVVIWEVLSAKRLFKAENDAATLSRLISDTIPPLMEMCPAAGERVSAVVAKALERDPDKRFSSCAEFASALELAAASGTGVGRARDLAAYVSDVIGNEIAQQRDAVRAWLARGEAGADAERWPAAVSGSQFIGPSGVDGQSSVTTNTGTAPSQVTIVSRGSSAPLLVALGAIIVLLGIIAALLFAKRNEPSGIGPRGEGQGRAVQDAPPVVDERARELRVPPPQPTDAPAAPELKPVVPAAKGPSHRVRTPAAPGKARSASSGTTQNPFR